MKLWINILIIFDKYSTYLQLIIFLSNRKKFLLIIRSYICWNKKLIRSIWLSRKKNLKLFFVCYFQSRYNYSKFILNLLVDYEITYFDISIFRCFFKNWKQNCFVKNLSLKTLKKSFFAILKSKIRHLKKSFFLNRFNFY